MIYSFFMYDDVLFHTIPQLFILLLYSNNL